MGLFSFLKKPYVSVDGAVYAVEIAGNDYHFKVGDDGKLRYAGPLTLKYNHPGDYQYARRAVLAAKKGS